MTHNKITHVASKFRGQIYSLPKPHRHSDIWLNLYKLFPNYRESEEERGFLDSEGNWLTRSGAYYRAQRTGQIVIDSIWKKNHPGIMKAGLLYSEDLW